MIEVLSDDELVTMLQIKPPSCKKLHLTMPGISAAVQIKKTPASINSTPVVSGSASLDSMLHMGALTQDKSLMLQSQLATTSNATDITYFPCCIVSSLT